MKIVIMRHGDADMFVAPDLELIDANRALTQQGIMNSLQSMHQFVQQTQHQTFDYVFVSPYLRAQQTWQAISKTVNASTIEICDDITPYGKAPNVVDYVTALVEVNKLQSVLIISHLPLVSYLAAEFASGITPPVFNTSTIAEIEYDPIVRKGHLLKLVSV